MVSSAIWIMVYNVIGVTRTIPFFVNLLVVLYNALSSYSVHLITLLYPHNFVSFFFKNIYSCRASLEPNQKVSSLLWLQLYILDPSLQKMYNCSKYVFPVSLANSTCHQLLSHPVSAMVLNGLEILAYETFSSIKVSCPVNPLVPSHRFKSKVFQRTLAQQSNSLCLGLPQLRGTHPGTWIGTVLETSLLVMPGTFLWSCFLYVNLGFALHKHSFAYWWLF